MIIDYQAIYIALIAAIKYVPVTLRLGIFSLFIGSLLGLAIALVRYFKVPFLSRFFQLVIPIIKGIPVVLILTVSYLIISDVYDKLAVAWQWNHGFKDINREYIALFVLAITATVNLSEVFRGALASLKKGQFEAAYSVGLTTYQTLYRIILPQLIPVATPMLGNQLIGLIKATSLVSMVSIVDVLNGALITATTSYSFLEAYIAAALVYWVLSIGVERLAVLIERYYIAKVGKIV